MAAQRRRLRRVDIEHPPRLGIPRPNALGWRVRVKLLDGQVPDNYAKACEALAHAWRVHAVRVIGSAPGRVWLSALRSDPLVRVVAEPETGELLRVAPGLLETGQPWVIDFRTVPHWLNAGATQSGKSNLANAIIKGLAPQPVALVGFDLKGGVEFTPYAPRMSALASTRAECVIQRDADHEVLRTSRMSSLFRTMIKSDGKSSGRCSRWASAVSMAGQSHGAKMTPFAWIANSASRSSGSPSEKRLIIRLSKVPGVTSA
jgi:hypothetical protein